MRLAFETVAVGRAATVSVPLPGVFRLAAPGLAAELLDLELVECLKDMADEPPLRACLVTGGDCVEDFDSRPGEFALVCEGSEEVASEP
jgi:hypothetical protein